ncbi:MAG: hypothetical protein AB7R67_20070 [Vicinamibacterales bacterium]
MSNHRAARQQSKRPVRILIYESRDGFRWRARRGRIVADSGEAYTRRRDATRAATAFVAAVKASAVIKQA